jgi:predicted helicase
MTTLGDVLQQLRNMSQTTHEQDDYFERLILRMLKVSPWYKDQFSDVWLWKEWPGRNRRIDAGIDIVAEKADTGDLIGIQCKFYEEGHYLDKAQLDSFFATLIQEPFKEGMVFSTTDNWSKQAESLLENPTKPVNDPNEWSDDPRYIIDLVKRIVRVSMETNRIVASLPPLNERDVEIKPGVMTSNARCRHPVHQGCHIPL